MSLGCADVFLQTAQSCHSPHISLPRPTQDTAMPSPESFPKQGLYCMQLRCALYIVHAFRHT